MEALDRFGDWFNSFTGGVERFITRLFGASNERQIKKIGYVRDKQGNASIVPGTVLDRVNRLEPEFQKLTDDELKQCAAKFRARLAAGETLDDLLPEAFAAVRESSWRYLKMRHYDVQIVGGYFLHHGIIAEMVTGEGKTLVATLPAFLNALTGSVHVITVNDYLALRDMEWMGPVYMGLGLTVSAIQASMDPHERQGPYSCDITYGTNNEFGFDYLRDNMKPRRDLQVQGSLDFAIVDEIDNILIDEARTPLIISGSAHDDVEKYAKADRVVRDLMGEQKKADAELKRQQAELEERAAGASQREMQELQKELLERWKNEHCCYEVNEKDHSCHMTDTGIRKAEELAGVESFYTAGNMEWPHLMDNALKAHHLYKKDVNYVVDNGDIVIVDEFTGRKMEGRQWSDGLHQAVEAKERVPIKEETQTLATITLQNYFKLYKKLAGMTGTAMTEASEFWKIYKLDVIAVPTNKPLRRVNNTDLIYRTEKEKWDAIVKEIRDVHETGRPILVGTVSIEKSELLSNKLKRFGIPHEVLNAKYHEREAEIIAQAGRRGGVTIATNMAGRGTDIILGGNPEHMAWEELKQRYESRLDVTKAEWDEITRKISEREGMDKEGREVAESGGLHVIGSERHDSRRIDLQLRGRSGRQGDPGSSRFFLSLEDDLMRIFMGEWVRNMLTRLGMQEGEAIESRMVQKRVEGAQKKREEMHFESRKNLLEYDEVMDDQRKKVYSYRQKILDGASCRDLILEMIREQVDHGAAEYLDPMFRWETLSAWLDAEMGVHASADQLHGMTKEQLVDYVLDEAVRQAETAIAEQMQTDLPEDRDPSEWKWLSVSKWANARWDLNTNDRELKKVGREALFDYLIKRAADSIEKYDFTYADTVLEENFPE
ncbi:MAG: preprotein translocase subunit SecA, partial [Planctomycetaceae bacterium]